MVIHLFGEKLKQLRKDKDITQTDIAKLFNVTDATVSAWEVGKAQPSYEVLIELAKYFGVTPNYFLGFSEKDTENIEKLKTIYKEMGLWNDSLDDINLEDFQKALQIVNMLKDTKK